MKNGTGQVKIVKKRVKISSLSFTILYAQLVLFIHNKNPVSGFHQNQRCIPKPAKHKVFSWLRTTLRSHAIFGSQGLTLNRLLKLRFINFHLVRLQWSWLLVLSQNGPNLNFFSSSSHYKPVSLSVMDIVYILYAVCSVLADSI